MQLFKYIFVAFYAWQCTIANASLVPNLDPIVPLPDLGGVIAPVLPEIPDIDDILPEFPDLGEVIDPVIPEIPDFGEILPELPDLGEVIDPVIPEIPDFGEILPELPDLGGFIPGLPLGSICRRGVDGRGVGTVMTTLCNSDEQEVAGLCYPKCQNGYENIGSNICRKIGCGELVGATDIGVSCEKPKSYGRGAGYFDLLTCVRQNVLCEKSGLLYYPTCKLGFSPFGCCVCSPNCPLEYIDDGAFCRKKSYDRGVGAMRLGCESNKEYNAGLCYQPCSNNGIGVGPLCWNRCSGLNSFECGIFCTATPLECATITLELGTSAVQIAANIAGLNAWGAIIGIYEAGRKILEPLIC